MAKEWKSKEFVAEETAVGHGRESVCRQVCDFLNKNGIQEGSAIVTCYPDTDFHGTDVVHALVFYRK